MHALSSYCHYAFCARTGMPFVPTIENYTVGPTWIYLTWYHNQSCCTDGKYLLSWEQRPSEEAVNSTMNPVQHPNITHLKHGTTYIVTLSVECHRYELQNATILVNTSIGEFMYALRVYTCMCRILSCVSYV